jgi:hypothetical protein
LFLAPGVIQTSINQNLFTFYFLCSWLERKVSNPQPTVPKTVALPIELLSNVMARLTGLEPATLGVTGRYSNQLSYNRVFLFM